LKFLAKFIKLDKNLHNKIFKKLSGRYLDLIYDESLTCRGLNSNLGHFDSFTFILILYGESCLLVSWCAGSRCDMMSSDEDHVRSRRHSAEDQGWSRTGQVLGDRVILCAVCTVHMEMMSADFLLEPQNHG
jgi:hypothetical protein